jgi:hypothetical protein
MVLTAAIGKMGNLNESKKQIDPIDGRKRELTIIIT